MSAENFGGADLGIPAFLDRRDEAGAGHVCAQCQGKPDGKEEPVRHGDALVWLHPECRRFWFREGPHQPEHRVEPVRLIKYDTACQALAQANSVDEVRDIRDKAIAIKAYARQAKNKDLEADAFEIRIRAERPLGEMMAEQPKATGGNFNKEKLRVSEKPATLAEAGIDKNLANRACQASAMPSKDFEVLIAKGREDVRRSVERAKGSTSRDVEHRNDVPVVDESPALNDQESEVADPATLEDSVLHLLSRINEHARVFRKLFKLSAFDREAESRINTAIDRMIKNWRLTQTTLTERSRANAKVKSSEIGIAAARAGRG